MPGVRCAGPGRVSTRHRLEDLRWHPTSRTLTGRCLGTVTGRDDCRRFAVPCAPLWRQAPPCPVTMQQPTRSCRGHRPVAGRPSLSSHDGGASDLQRLPTAPAGVQLGCSPPRWLIASGRNWRCCPSGPGRRPAGSDDRPVARLDPAHAARGSVSVFLLGDQRLQVSGPRRRPSCGRPGRDELQALSAPLAAHDRPSVRAHRRSGQVARRRWASRYAGFNGSPPPAAPAHRSPSRLACARPLAQPVEHRREMPTRMSSSTPGWALRRIAANRWPHTSHPASNTESSRTAPRASASCIRPSLKLPRVSTSSSSAIFASHSDGHVLGFDLAFDQRALDLVAQHDVRRIRHLVGIDPDQARVHPGDQAVQVAGSNAGWSPKASRTLGASCATKPGCAPSHLERQALARGWPSSAHWPPAVPASRGRFCSAAMAGLVHRAHQADQELVPRPAWSGARPQARHRRTGGR